MSGFEYDEIIDDEELVDYEEVAQDNFNEDYYSDRGSNYSYDSDDYNYEDDDCEEDFYEDN